ncbi:hypothetical protein NAC44_01265 [Allorhizobium sp. BGMRC 0089]|uniref:hypothetical protein n=1 Tax=Allorhizobium sonneratiae TaxID=2934936 RepID=UPI0020338C03|nr:hypothetical protein [Allorhizobium sonneratiae]MCM2290955.1 hypothetical protein [Allorhizobium sonneratiae]
MSVLHKTMSAGLLATVVGVSLIASTSAADARPHFWGGVAAGALGGIIGSAIINDTYHRPVYYYPEYAPPPPPPPRVIYRQVYVPACHYEWRHDYYGYGYRVRVCPD